LIEKYLSVEEEILSTLPHGHANLGMLEISLHMTQRSLNYAGVLEENRTAAIQGVHSSTVGRLAPPPAVMHMQGYQLRPGTPFRNLKS
jgi:hypothetical protein